MRTWIALAVAIACVLVPQASAKGPVALCGTNGCSELGTESSFIQWSPASYTSHVRPAAPAPFFELQFSDFGSVLAFWVPTAGVLRVSDGGGPATWVKPTSTALVLLSQVSSGFQPFAAPTRVEAMVDLVDVPRGSATYLRLFTMGTPVPGAVRAKGWVPIDMFGAQTPWTDDQYWMWIAKAGPFVRHVDGDVMRISPRAASKIRHRLPLTG